MITNQGVKGFLGKTYRHTNSTNPAANKTATLTITIFWADDRKKLVNKFIRIRPQYSKLLLGEETFSIQVDAIMSPIKITWSGGEVVNSAVRKTAIRGCKSRPDLKKQIYSITLVRPNENGLLN